MNVSFPWFCRDVLQKLARIRCSSVYKGLLVLTRGLKPSHLGAPGLQVAGLPAPPASEIAFVAQREKASAVAPWLDFFERHGAQEGARGGAGRASGAGAGGG